MINNHLRALSQKFERRLVTIIAYTREAGAKPGRWRTAILSHRELHVSRYVDSSSESRKQRTSRERLTATLLFNFSAHYGQQSDPRCVALKAEIRWINDNLVEAYHLIDICITLDLPKDGLEIVLRSHRHGL